MEASSTFFLIVRCGCRHVTTILNDRSLLSTSLSLDTGDNGGLKMATEKLGLMIN